jgi:hypothetical protein
VRDMDLFESSELTPEQASRVIGGITGTPKIGGTGVTDAVVGWIEGMICRPYTQSPDGTETYGPDQTY